MAETSGEGARAPPPKFGHVRRFALQSRNHLDYPFLDLSRSPALIGSRKALGRGFERLYRLIPEIEFEVHDVAVRGWPWDTAVSIEWTDRGRAADGSPYENHGAHWIRLRWGKGVEVHGYLDTAKLDAVLERLPPAGIQEATAAPIT